LEFPALNYPKVPSGLRPLSESDEYVTYPQVAQRLGVCTLTVRKWVETGKFPKPIKLGRSVRWNWRAVQEFLNSRGA
jgi:excisionase family DNA binding protein